MMKKSLNEDRLFFYDTASCFRKDVALETER